MKNNKLHIFESGLIALTALMLLLSGPGFTHCRGEDGHSHIEPAYSGCCETDYADACCADTELSSSSEGVMTANSDLCFQCIDRFIRTEVPGSFPNPLKIRKVSAALHIAQEHYEGFELLISSVPPVLINPSVCSVRTVVLRA